MNLGWTINDLPKKTEIRRNTRETNISLEFSVISEKECHVSIMGSGDLEHHLIEDMMIVLNKLAELKGVSHRYK